MAKHESVRDLITSFLRAENARDWETYRSFLAPSIEWTLYGRESRVVRGIDDYMRVMQSAYAGREARFTIGQMAVNEVTGVVFVELVIDGLRSVDVFEVQGGQIIREREYFGY